jgi:hypothetical protein
LGDRPSPVDDLEHTPQRRVGEDDDFVRRSRLSGHRMGSDGA